MNHQPRQERRTEQAATTALLVVMLVLAASAAGVDRVHVRPGGTPCIAPVAGVACSTLAEGSCQPGCGLLEPPSETLASVGTRSGSQVVVDLAHLAGSSLELERRRHDLPPPSAA